MNYCSQKEDKIALIQKYFGPLVGQKIDGYELPQYWYEEDKEWSDWMDLPLILKINKKPLSISWCQFEDFAIDAGRPLPFSLVDTTVKWISEGNKYLDSIIGQEIKSVALGRGEMTMEGKDIEIWTRLLIELSDGRTLDVFNALDENGVDVIDSNIEGELIKCL
jgi:hypothetical protein